MEGKQTNIMGIDRIIKEKSDIKIVKTGIFKTLLVGR